MKVLSFYFICGIIDLEYIGGTRMEIKKLKSARGALTVPGDKSISHRAVMLGSLADGVTEIAGFLPGADCLSTIDCFRNMGVEIDARGDSDCARQRYARSCKARKNAVHR